MERHRAVETLIAVEVVMLGNMHVTGNCQEVLALREDLEELLTVGNVDLRLFRISLRMKWNVHREHNQPVDRDPAKIVGNPRQLTFADPTRIRARTERIRVVGPEGRALVHHRVQHDEVHLTVFKGVVRRAEVSAKGVQSLCIGCGQLVDVVISGHVVPRHSNLGDVSI